MPETWSAAVVRLSDSFGATVDQILARLGAGVVEWSPGGDEAAPLGAAVIVLLAGGAEDAALDVLADLPPSATPAYVVGAAADHRLAAAAMQRGARDYFALPDDLDLLRRSLDRESRRARGRTEAARFAAAERGSFGFEAILGESPALRRALEFAARAAARGDVTVLIGGETGTGKDLLARAIHYHSPRGGEPFVEINCAAIPANLLESELFGHEKGAFTGATATKPGLFELADRGTLFLDEIGNLPLELQPKLLRALESKKVRRVGGQTTRQVDVRVIAATHVDLPAAIARGEFREDLYYRLNVVSLALPPLRERAGDVELLAARFMAATAEGFGLPVPPLTDEVRAALRAHAWPGNVRELRNTIERALVLSPSGTLLADLFRPPANGTTRAAPTATLPFPSDLATISRAAAQAMLDLVGGNRSEAARRLGISRPKLVRLLTGSSD